MKRNKWLIFLGLSSAVLLLISMPANHTEAEDAFEYARLAEEGGAALFHGHHLLYLPLMRGVYGLTHVLGLSTRAFPLMQGFSMVCGVGAVLFCFVLVAQLTKSRVCGMISALGLLFSYGFWRYAVEVEIYVPAIAISLILYWAVLRSTRMWQLVLCGLLAGFAVLIHVINLIPVLAALLAWLCRVRPWRDGFHPVSAENPSSHSLLSSVLLSSLAYLLPAASLAAGAYAFVARGPGIWLLPAPTQSFESGLRLTSIFKSLIGFGQCVVSGNFLFCWPQFIEKLQAVFPYRYFAEEAFMAEHAFPFAAIAGLLTLSLLLICGLFFLIRFISGLTKSYQQPSALSPLSSDIRFQISNLLPLVFWLFGAAGVVFYVEAGNPELWVPVLVPLWLFLGVVAARLSAGCRNGLAAVVIALGLHNAVGGMALIKSPKSDYNVQKAARIISEAKEGDVILTADTFVFSFYLNYWTDAEVLNVNTRPVELSKLAGRVFVFNDVFDPPVSMGIRYPEYKKRVDKTAQQLQPLRRRFYIDCFGGAWMLDGHQP